MSNIIIGNNNVDIMDSVFIQSRADSVDPAHWYTDIFKTLPVYKCTIRIYRKNEDEDIDIYSVIFNELINSGKFTALNYEYGNNDDSLKLPHLDLKDSKTIKDIYVHKFFVVSNYYPLAISYEYGELMVMSHTGTNKINEFIDNYINKYNEEDDRAKCYIIVKDGNLYLNEFTIKLHNDLDFDLYNDGFEDVHNDIVKSIESDENGLYLLYGAPGTGKTTYIRHLIKQCGTDKRKFVYVPSSLFGDFTDPGFLPFLLEHKGCIFIIEDCESLVTTNNGIRSEDITNLLNMADGLLNDALNIKIICTFNIDDCEIDEALLRPGRCRCRYEFDLLNKDKANKATEKYGLKPVSEDVSLGKLFNPDKSFDNEKKKKLGFKV